MVKLLCHRIALSIDQSFFFFCFQKGRHYQAVRSRSLKQSLPFGDIFKVDDLFEILSNTNHKLFFLILHVLLQAL